MIIGLVPGSREGWLDLGLRPVMVALMAIPGVVIALAIVYVLKSRTTNGMLTIAVVIIPGDSHIVRAAVLSAKQNPYVEAVQVLGCRHLRLITGHILPSVTATVLITADRGLMAGCRLHSGQVAEWAT